MRETLINAIFDLSGDEFENINDVIILAKENEEQLVARLIQIAYYYKDK